MIRNTLIQQSVCSKACVITVLKSLMLAGDSANGWGRTSSATSLSVKEIVVVTGSGKLRGVPVGCDVGLFRDPTHSCSSLGYLVEVAFDIAQFFLCLPWTPGFLLHVQTTGVAIIGCSCGGAT